ncbi:MAG: UdgX family uracil-DNA binding protein [Pseudomonadota bacterium]
MATTPDDAPALDALRQAARTCTNCPLWRNATQTVFGEGDPHALVMLVGEQPGDQEDLAGHPFVGPAGRLLDQALERAGVDRSRVYITNAVKHFKWEPRGKRRMHKTPGEREIAACSPWLQGEIRSIRPRVIVCLGATAARAVIGRDFKVSRQRGRFVPSPWAEFVFATVHPSAILRIPDALGRQAALADLVEDLKLIGRALARGEGDGVTRPAPGSS